MTSSNKEETRSSILTASLIPLTSHPISALLACDMKSHPHDRMGVQKAVKGWCSCQCWFSRTKTEVEQ